MELNHILQNLQIQELNQMQKSTINSAKDNIDIVLISPTGSGKTIAFLVPVIQNLQPEEKGVQCLILVPTRELALQIEQVFKKSKTNYKVTVCYGGHNKSTEVKRLAEAPAVLIGTPGRIMDHLQHEAFDPSTIKTLVLDEFDKSLEFGFQKEMGFIIDSLKNLSQKILTSATAMEEIPDFVGLEEYRTLDFLNLKISQPNIKFLKVLTTADEKLDTLFHLLCKIGNQKTIIFCNHRDAVDRISSLLHQKGIQREVFHGGMEQDEREKALIKFRNNSSNILITTDLAARGLDIPNVESIVHYQLPPQEDAFIHRNGRTARMNNNGYVYLIMKEDDVFPFLDKNIDTIDVTHENTTPQKPKFETLYISAGKQDKMSKTDIAGFLMKVAKLHKEAVGIIEIKDKLTYVAIDRKQITNLINKFPNPKIKGKKVKLEVAN